MAKMGHTWQERRPLQRTVRILLECILIFNVNMKHWILVIGQFYCSRNKISGEVIDHLLYSMNISICVNNLSFFSGKPRLFFCFFATFLALHGCNKNKNAFQ